MIMLVLLKKYKPNLLKNTSSCITNRYIRNVYDRTFKNEALISTMLEEMSKN